MLFFVFYTALAAPRHWTSW